MSTDCCIAQPGISCGKPKPQHECPYTTTKSRQCADDPGKPGPACLWVSASAVRLFGRSAHFMTLLRIVSCTVLLACLGLNAQAQAAPSEGKSTSPTWHDPSPHKVQLITVEKDAQVEVLDWGGSGRNVVLLAGLGNTAHIFDNFAPKLS